MQKYKITYSPNNDPEKFEGIYGVSLVGQAANGHKWVMLSNQTKAKIELKTGDRDRQLLVSPVLVPEQEIFRDWTADGCTIQFNSETIEKASHDFIKNGYQNKSTIDHDGNFINGVSIVETWIVEDPAMDKSKTFGFDVPKGTWMSIMKVDDSNLWNNYIKTGELTGFSIDSYFGIEKIYEDVRLSINNNKQKTKNNMFKNLFKSTKKVSLAVEMLEIEVEGLGKLVSEDFSEGFLVLQEVDGVQSPLVDSTFVYEGKEISTDSEGLISSIKDVEEEAVPVADVAVELANLKLEMAELRKSLNLETVAELEQVVDDRADELEDIAGEAKQAPTLEEAIAKINELEAVINTMKDEVEAKAKALEDTQAEVVELKKQPATSTFTAYKKSAVDLSKMTPLERFRATK